MSRNRPGLITLALIILLPTVSASGVYASGQTITATLVGTVRDAGGDALPGAEITVTSLATNISRKATSDAQGDFTVTYLQPGVYSVAAEATGFKRALVARVELLVNQTARVDMSLQPGQLSESVEVQGTAAALNVTDWLIENNLRNVIIEIANEHDVRTYDHDRYIHNQMGHLIELVRRRFQERKAAFRLPITASTGGSMRVFDGVRDHADLVIIHGNHRTPEEKKARVAELAADPKMPGPIYMNEDDSGRETTPEVLANELASCDAVFNSGGSWGYMPWRQLQMFPFRFYLPSPGAKVTADMPVEVLKRIGEAQIAALYGARFRGVPVFFLQDDHDYFENDDANDRRVTFPPDHFMWQLSQATRRLYYPEFLPDAERPLGLPGASAADTPPGTGESYGTLRFGRLAEVLLYDCRRYLTLAGPNAVVVAPEAEAWLKARMDLKANPVNVLLAGPISTGTSWPSAARGTKPTPSLHVEVEERLPCLEENGFTLVDFTPEKITARLFRWSPASASAEAGDGIDRLEPFHTVEYQRPA